MNTRQRTLFCCLAFFGGIFAANAGEPSWDGHKLSWWLAQIEPAASLTNNRIPLAAIERMGGQAVPYLVKELRVQDSAVKRGMMRMNQEAEIKLGRDLLTFTRSDSIRARAALALGALNTNAFSAVPEVARNLADPELASDSAWALSMLGSPGCAALISNSTSRLVETRELVAWLLGQLDDFNTKTAPVLSRLATDLEPRVRRASASSFGAMTNSPSLAVPPLIRLVSDADKEVCSQAISSLGKHGTNALPALSVLSNAYANPGLRIGAGVALRKLGEPALPTFLNQLASPDAGARRHAIQNIGGMGGAARNLVPQLMPFLKDPDFSLRSMTAVTVQRIVPDLKQLIPSFLAALETEDHQVVIGALLTLFTRLGEDGKEASTKLAEFAQAAEGDERMVFLAALASVNPGKARELGAPEMFIEWAPAERERLRLDRSRNPALPTLNQQPTAAPPPPLR